MGLIIRIRHALRRRSLTPEELVAREEAKVVREQMLQDRLRTKTQDGQGLPPQVAARRERVVRIDYRLAQRSADA